MTDDEANPYEKSHQDLVFVIEREIERRLDVFARENARYKAALEEIRDSADAIWTIDMATKALKGEA